MKSTTQTAAQKLAPKTKKPSLAEMDAKCARAIEINAVINPLKEELDKIKTWFMDKVFLGEKTGIRTALPHGTVIQKLTNKYTIQPQHIAELKLIFKKDLPKYITTKAEFGATAMYKKLLLDADYEHSKVIRNAVLIKQTPSVVFEPICTPTTNN